MTEAQRVQRNTPSTLIVSFYSNESLIDPDSNSVMFSALKADGTSHTSSTAATRISQGKYSYLLPGQASLNKLRTYWAGAIGGQAVTLELPVEVVGGFFFTVSQLRSEYPVDMTPAKFSYDAVIDKRNEVENEFERICRRAFTPSYDYQTMEGDGSRELWLDHPDVYAITRLTVDGVDRIAWYNSGYIRVDRDNSKLIYFTERSGMSWPDQAPIIIEYEYGYRTVPFQIHTAAMQRTRTKLDKKTSKISSRATVVSADFGRVNLATPGMDMGFGRYVRSGLGVWHTGEPDVDIILESYRYKDEGVA